MYKLSDYVWMMEDEVRAGAYMAALQKTVKPGDVVIDLGAGVGTWALLSCQLGARKVYAIEVSPALHVAKRLAAANGFSDKIELIQEFSTAIELPEKADVIIFDLHGQQPVFGSSLASIIDARKRFLKEGGALIPARETMWATVVEDPKRYQQHAGFWEKPYRGLDMKPGKKFALDWLYKERFSREQVLTDQYRYADLDYYKLEDPQVVADFVLTAQRGGTGHGVYLWFDSEMGFDSELAAGIGFSNAPGNPLTIFSGSFLAWPEPVELEAGDKIHISVGFRPFSGDYIWHCSARVTSGDTTKAEYSQSSIWDTLPKLNTLNVKR